MPQSHILLSKAIWPFHIFKGHLGHARFSKASWPLIFFKCHLGNAILSKAMWPFFPRPLGQCIRQADPHGPRYSYRELEELQQDTRVVPPIFYTVFAGPGHRCVSCAKAIWPFHTCSVYLSFWLAISVWRPNGHPAFCSTQKCIFIMTGRCVQLAKPAAAESCPGQRAQTRYQIALAAKRPAACIGTPTKATRPFLCPCHEGHKAIVSCMLQRPLAIFYKPFFWVNIPVTGSHSPAAQDFQPESHSTQHPSWHPRQPWRAPRPWSPWRPWRPARPARPWKLAPMTAPQPMPWRRSMARARCTRSYQGSTSTFHHCHAFQSIAAPGIASPGFGSGSSRLQATARFVAAHGPRASTRMDCNGECETMGHQQSPGLFEGQATMAMSQSRCSWGQEKLVSSLPALNGPWAMNAQAKATGAIHYWSLPFSFAKAPWAIQWCSRCLAFPALILFANVFPCSFCIQHGSIRYW